jgi:hypothetical protein
LITSDLQKLLWQVPINSRVSGTLVFCISLTISCLQNSIVPATLDQRNTTAYGKSSGSEKLLGKYMLQEQPCLFAFLAST